MSDGAWPVLDDGSATECKWILTGLSLKHGKGLSHTAWTQTAGAYTSAGSLLLQVKRNLACSACTLQNFLNLRYIFSVIRYIWYFLHR